VLAHDTTSRQRERGSRIIILKDWWVSQIEACSAPQMGGKLTWELDGEREIRVKDKRRVFDVAALRLFVLMCTDPQVSDFQVYRYITDFGREC
jgi:hypothetical protein